MPIIVAESSTMAENNRYRKAKTKNQPMLDTDPSTLQIPSIIQSTRCKSTISSENTTPKKKNFTSATFRGLGCAASPQVSVPGVIKTSAASWDAKKVKKKKQRSLQHKKNKGPFQGVAMVHGNSLASSSTCVVDPDVWCGPGIGIGIGIGTDAAASVDCVVSRRPVSGRGKVDGVRINQRERSSFGGRRTVNHEAISFFDAEFDQGMSRPQLNVFNSRHNRHVRHPSPEGLAEIVMLQSSLLMGGRSSRLDRYRDLRLDVDSMSYEELLDLGDRIGYVSTGLKEDEIVRSLRKTKLSPVDELSSDISTDWKCSICQEEYTAEDDMGKLECGHSYHIQCIKNWLVKKNACPICKTAVASQQ